MGGEDRDGPWDTPAPPEDLGSVGDWRMPSWMPHSGLAWLFIALTVLSVVVRIPMVVAPFGLSAFAAGLGNPDAVEPDAPRIELDPLPSPG